NRQFAINTFQWIADNFEAPAPPSGGRGGGGSTPPPVSKSGKGYWFLGRDGTVYAFGDTKNHGSLRNGTPAAAIASRPNGDGYWIVDRNGIVHAYGNAPTHGDMRAFTLNAPIISLEPTPT